MAGQNLGHALAPAVVILLSLSAGALAEGGESTLVPREEVAAYTMVEEAVVVETVTPPIGQPSSAALEPTSVPKLKTERLPAAKTAANEAARMGTLRALVERHAEENGIPFALAHAVVRVESRYDPGARNGPHYGLTQINARTARALGYTGSAAGLLDPDTNLRYGIKYLAQAYELAKGDTCGAIQRYRGGHRPVTISRATRVYCAKVVTITASAE